MKKQIAVLISGTGTTLQNIYRETQTGFIDAEIGLVISSNEEALGYRWAIEQGLNAVAAPPEAASLVAGKFYLIVLAGYTRKFHMTPALQGRVVNIHPSLLPAFGGKGMYGERVHKAVLESGVKWTGCTAHFVTSEYDSGPIIAQEVIKVDDFDTVETLMAKVKISESWVYPLVIRNILKGNLRVEGKRVYGKLHV